MWNNDSILELVLKAGQKALEYFNNIQLNLKEDGSIVTKADIEIEAIIREELEDIQNNIYVLGEEDAAKMDQKDLDHALEKECYVVDPIDGTANYANGFEMWAIGIGYLQKGVFKKGCIYLPLLRKIYLFDGESTLRYEVIEGYSLGASSPMKRPQLKSLEGVIAVSQVMLESSNMHFKHPVHAISCAMYVISKLLEGSYKAYFGSLKVWDIAPAIPMLKQLGFDYHLINGQTVYEHMNNEWLYLEKDHPKRFSIRDTILICKPEDREVLLSSFS